MGRYIGCEVNGESLDVYKYGLGEQSSEMYRISEELRIGEYHLISYTYDEETDEASYEYIDESSEDVDGDILILDRTDIEKLGSVPLLLMCDNGIKSDKKREKS